MYQVINIISYPIDNNNNNNNIQRSTSCNSQDHNHNNISNIVLPLLPYGIQSQFIIPIPQLQQHVQQQYTTNIPNQTHIKQEFPVPFQHSQIKQQVPAPFLVNQPIHNNSTQHIQHTQIKQEPKEKEDDEFVYSNSSFCSPTQKQISTPIKNEILLIRQELDSKLNEIKEQNQKYLKEINELKETIRKYEYSNRSPVIDKNWFVDSTPINDNNNNNEYELKYEHEPPVQKEIEDDQDDEDDDDEINNALYYGPTQPVIKSEPKDDDEIEEVSDFERTDDETLVVKQEYSSSYCYGNKKMKRDDYHQEKPWTIWKKYKMERQQSIY